MRPLTPNEQLTRDQAGHQRRLEQLRREIDDLTAHVRSTTAMVAGSYDDPGDDGGTVYVITTTDTRSTP